MPFVDMLGVLVLFARVAFTSSSPAVFSRNELRLQLHREGKAYFNHFVEKEECESLAKEFELLKQALSKVLPCSERYVWAHEEEMRAVGWNTTSNILTRMKNLPGVFINAPPLAASLRGKITLSGDKICNNQVNMYQLADMGRDLWQLVTHKNSDGVLVKQVLWHIWQWFVQLLTGGILFGGIVKTKYCVQ
jgi:hypothetical protein